MAIRHVAKVTINNMIPDKGYGWGTRMDTLEAVFLSPPVYRSLVSSDAREGDQFTAVIDYLDGKPRPAATMILPDGWTPTTPVEYAPAAAAVAQPASTEDAAAVSVTEPVLDLGPVEPPNIQRLRDIRARIRAHRLPANLIARIAGLAPDYISVALSKGTVPTDATIEALEKALSPLARKLKRAS